MANEEKERKIVSDDDWKNQAKAEKEKLIEKEKQADKPAQQSVQGGEQKQPKPGQFPPASFLSMVNLFAAQTMHYLGILRGPEGDQKPQINLDVAKHHIDMLSILDEKTKGNLTEQESQLLSRTLHELRMQYVSIAQI